MSFFRSRITLTFVLMFVLVLALVVLLVPAQVAQSQGQGPYSGPTPDYRMYLKPVGWPGGGTPNPDPHVYIPRPRVPQPKEPYPVPIDSRVSASLPLPAPADESLAINQKSNANKDSAYASGNEACLNFDASNDWGSISSGYTLFDDQFAGWGTFAVDNSGIYQVENVLFTREESIRFGQYAIKMHSDMPYTAGMASPIIKVSPNVTVTVTVKYYIRNNGQQPVDWASMGVKPNAHAPGAVYVNGYTRGQWATLSNTVKATSTDVMVLLQAQNPRNIDSNIYFDEVTIQVGDRLLGRCGLEKDLKSP